jgi:hypothetical protein
MKVVIKFDFDCEDLGNIGTRGELRRLISDYLTDGAEAAKYFIDNIELLDFDPE